MNFFGCLRLLRKFSAFLIDALVLDRTVHGVGAVREFALHPFQVRETRTIDILVDHAHRNERCFRGKLGKGQRKFALLRHCERVYASFAPAARSAFLKGLSRQATG